MRHLVLILLLVIPGKLLSQEKDIFLELGGSGGLGSFNFENWIPPAATKDNGKYNNHLAGPKPWWFGIRVGMGASPIDKNNGWVLVFPVMGSIAFQPDRSAHALEVSAGFAPSITTKGAFFIKSPLALGYRYWPHDRKMFFRATYTPILAWLVDVQWQHWFGVSIGYSFAYK